VPFDPEESNFSDEDRHAVTIIDEKLYLHKTLRINYTTYDVRHSQDTLNPRTHADIMILSQEDQEDSDGHPYWYRDHHESRGPTGTQ
jgi:hypothetical protein